MADTPTRRSPSFPISADERLVRVVTNHWQPGEWLEGGVVLAVSGGADSMALLRLAAVLASERLERVAVAHFDHRLRPDSTADAEFVVAACGALGFGCRVGVWADPPAIDRGGMEAAARRARYLFLAQAAAECGFRSVATAHTADDQAETILHRVLRGTGLRGLAGIRPARPLSPEITLVRPLLEVRRSELVEYLTTIGQPFRTDPTNLDRRRTRNRLRHELLPLLSEQFNPQAGAALARLGALAGEAQDAFDELAARLLARSLTTRAEERVEIDVSAWGSEPRYLAQVALQRLWVEQRWPEQGMNTWHWRRLVRLAQSAAPGGLSLPGAITAFRRRNELVLQISRSHAAD